MRTPILGIFIVAMLFMSLEGAAEPVNDTQFHQTHHAHDAGDQWFPDSDGNDHDGDSCEHFCHAHAAALTARLSFSGMPMLRHFAPAHVAQARTRGAAPPIPPPNI